MTKAIILAAGMGVRINGTAGGSPKCLLTVGGVTLIERQIEILRSHGINQLIIVVGCQAERVKSVCGTDCAYVENNRFETTNSLYSLWLAREYLGEGFVVLNSDVLFDSGMLSILLSTPFEDALLFEPSYDESSPLGDEEMKVRVRNGLIVEIAKTIDPKAAHGENVGILKFGESGARFLIEQMDLLVASGNDNAWAPQAFQEFAINRPLYAVSTAGYPWIEIDFIEDYERANVEILPRLKHPRDY
jgi:choline kinase